MRVERVDVFAIEREVAGVASDVNIKSQSLSRAYGSVLVLRIVCEDGVTGEIMTFGTAPALGREMAKYIRDFLVGRDIRYREALWQEMWANARLWFSHPWIVSLVDIALWDAYAKSLGAPLYQLLGGYRDKVPVYASSFTHESAEGFVEEALAYREAGYQAYKLHVSGDVAMDIETCTKVREAVGPAYPLMVDAVSGYDQLDALRVGRVLGELEYTWFEEPLRDYQLHGYRELCRQLDVPVMAGEMTEGYLYLQPEYITTGATDLVRGDVLVKGGISQLMKTAALADAFGLRLEVHTFANPLIDMANLHCSAAIKNTTYFEQLVPRELVTFGMAHDFVIDDEGFVHVPQEPGLGLPLDWDYITSRTVETL